MIIADVKSMLFSVYGIYASCCLVFIGHISNPSLLIQGISIMDLNYAEIIQLHTNKNSVRVHFHSVPIYQDTKYLFSLVLSLISKII